MKDDKTLMNFRFTKDQKRQLEHLAKKSGMNSTKFLELLLKGEIEDCLVREAHTAAIEIAAIKMGIDPKIANGIAANTEFSEQLDQIKTLLKDDERFKTFFDEFEDAWFHDLRVRYEAFGLEAPETFIRRDLYCTHRVVKTY